MFNIQEAVEAAAAVGPNMNEAVAGGGGERELPAAGLVRLRFISYIELGSHEEEFKGEKKKKDKVALQFECSGPKHPPREVEIDGVKKMIPTIITINENVSLNEKANFFKMFKRLNHTGEAKHFAQLLGRDFLGTIVHVERGEGDKKKTYANLRDDSGYTIRPPYVEDPETGESRRVEVATALTPLKCFIWNAPVQLKEMWGSLFIDGRWPDKKDDKTGEVTKEGASKNYWQNTIRSALNFKGSPIAELLFAGGEPDLPPAEKPERSDEDKQASADAAAGASGDPLAEM